MSLRRIMSGSQAVGASFGSVGLYITRCLQVGSGNTTLRAGSCSDLTNDKVTAFTGRGTLAPQAESLCPPGQRRAMRTEPAPLLRVGEISALGIGTTKFAGKRRKGARPNGRCAGKLAEKSGTIANGSGRCIGLGRQLVGTPFRFEISAPRAVRELRPAGEHSWAIRIDNVAMVRPLGTTT